MQRRVSKTRKTERPDRPIRSLFFALLLPFVILAGPAFADIVNSAVASGVHGGTSVQSGGAQATVGIAPGTPALEVGVEAAMTGNPAPGLPNGDVIGYSITIANTGNVGLVGVRLTLELQQDGESFTPTDPPRYEGGDTDNPGVLDRGETWRYTASYKLARPNLENGGDILATVSGAGRAGDRSAANERELAMPVPTLQGIERTDVSLAHTPSAIAAGPGDQVDYTLTISNRSAKPVSVRLRARLADGVRLVAGSVLEDGEVADVAVDGQRVDFGVVSVGARSNVSLRYLGEIIDAPARGYLLNSAQIADPDSLIPLLPPSLATVRTSSNPPGCTEISLLVYQDENRNGFADADEAGISGARITAGQDTLLTSDVEGQFATPCMEVSRLGEVGMMFELDEATLPEGYHATTTNPVSLRVEAGGSGSVSFGVASARILRVDLNAAAFDRNETKPDESFLEGITQLISALQREPSILRLTYYANRERVDLPEERLDEVRQAILERWAAAGNAYELEIEARVIHGDG